MGWASKKALPAKAAAPQPILVGLDLNATSARAVQGPDRALPRSLYLDDAREALPMALSLERRQVQVGRPGTSLCRLSPHLVCSGFLVHLGDQREWRAGRHRVDAAKAMAYVFERVQPSVSDVKALVAAVPAYLSRTQTTLLTPLADRARLPMIGTIRAPLAAALTAHASEPWTGLALVLDADDHALTASLVLADGEQLWIHATKAWPALGLQSWKVHLLNKVADRCIRQSRRDPRDSAPAEQSLYDQLEDALDRIAQGRMVELLIQTTSWYQNLLLRPEDFISFSQPMIGESVQALQTMLAGTPGGTGLHQVLVTASVGRLPGLMASLQPLLHEPIPVAEVPSTEDFGEDLLEPTADFGEDLMPVGPASVRLSILPVDAIARAAHDLAGRFIRGELTRGHLDQSVPLPSAETALPVAPPTKKTFRLFSAGPDR